ncbi:hypothetical protein [Ruthenibacterium lactatiformans]|uniref:hypothetical protein n=1 Tax=Ruthenibacterium lactatiformans TaxID=1550024 RepID=UPI0012E0A50B|nr:hypothetical protein [Ruthenibacterium lactatiformans]
MEKTGEMDLYLYVDGRGRMTCRVRCAAAQGWERTVLSASGWTAVLSGSRM